LLLVLASTDTLGFVTRRMWLLRAVALCRQIYGMKRATSSQFSILKFPSYEENISGNEFSHRYTLLPENNIVSLGKDAFSLYCFPSVTKILV
jgi:hypothetical protein